MADTEITAIKPQRHIVLRIIISIVSLAAVVALFAGILQGVEWLFVHAIAPACFLILRGDSPTDHAIRFFIGILAKVMILLVGLIYLVGFVRTYFSPERTRKLLVGKHEIVGNILAALLGILTPFCTCSAISLFIGFIEAGIPLGVTLSFLIAAPMINEIAVGMLANMFGWQVAGLYIGCGLVIAIVAGWIIGRLNSRELVEDWVWEIQMGNVQNLDEDLTIRDRLKSSWDNLKDIMGRIWLFVTIGIAAAAAIHGYVPDDAFGRWLGGHNWWSVPIAVLVGVPMYGNAGGAVPIMQVMLEKGAAMGTALAFMMGMVGLSLPEMIVLRKVLKPKMIAIFVGVVTVGILIVGYLFNWVLK